MLQLDSLTRRYGTNVALDNLSFNVKPGEVVGFLGPNGAGKTTAMRAVLNIVTLDSGEVRWQGKRVNLESALRFGYMPEERGLYQTMAIKDQLVFLGRLHGMDKDTALERAASLLETLGLPGRMNARLDSLSMGNQQRVQMAAALLHSPELLVLDEPFSGLDPTGIESLSEVLKGQASNGIAVVFSSHQLDLVEGLCERVVIINKGKLVVEGNVRDLTTASNILEVAVAGDTTASWAQSLDGIQVTDVRDDRARLVLTTATPDEVLDGARNAGTVTHFTYERRRLSEIFRESVTQ